MWFFSKRAPDAPPPTPKQILEAAQRDVDPTSVAAKPDLGRTIYERIRPRLRADIRDLFEGNRGVIGEVRRQTPNAFAVYAPPDGYVIRVYTGLHSLFHQVARVLMTSATIHSSANEAPEQPTRDPAQATEEIACIISSLKNGDEIDPPGDEGLSPAKLKLATELAVSAEDFVICHEFGHIAEWLGRGGNPGEILPKEEYEADFNALGFIIGAGAAWPVQKRLDRRMAYAGAEFALRIFTSLEHLDYQFETTHPLPGGRLLKLRESARRVFGSQRRFLEISTIAFSWDQQMEAIEARIAGEAKAKRFVVGLTADRLLSTFTVLIEECARGRMSAEFAAAEMTGLAQGLPEDLIDEIGKQAVSIYVTDGPLTANLQNAQLRFAEDEAFKDLMPSMPANLRQAIQRHWPAPPT